MPQHLIGVDIGASAVRAAEVSVHDGQIVLHRFAQIGLRRGAVQAGEITDVDDVARAVKQLWQTAGFTHRRVVMGIGSTRSFVRTHELPAMSDEETRQALSYEASELFPLVGDVQLDFEVIGERFDEAGGVRCELLVVAVHPQSVDNLLQVAQKARLSPIAIDLNGLAAVRALTKTRTADDNPGGMEAIVSVGADVTTVAIHQDGVPRFARISGSGGTSLTADISRILGITYEEAEATKRGRVLGASEDQRSLTATAVAERVSTVADEIASSIQFGNRGLAAVKRVLLTGGGSRSSGLFEAIEAQLSIPVEPGRLLEGLETTHSKLTENDLIRAEPVMAVPLGLALAAQPAADGWRPINLLPLRVEQERRARGEAYAMTALVVVAGAGLYYAWHKQGPQVGQQQAALATAQQNELSLNLQLDKLLPINKDVAEITKEEGLISEALADDVNWTSVLLKISSALPEHVWLSSFSGNAPSGPTPGQVNMEGFGLSHDDTAAWLIDESRLSILAYIYVSSSDRGYGPSLTSFAGSGYLTSAAANNRLSIYTSGPSK